MEQVLPLQEASRIVQNSIVKGEAYVMVDIFGNCEKLSFRLGGHVKGKYTKEGLVTWESSPYKSLPQAYEGVRNGKRTKT